MVAVIEIECASGGSTFDEEAECEGPKADRAPVLLLELVGAGSWRSGGNGGDDDDDVT